jgi:aspartyl-tRNA(Asn)/glutamyl-tRNA(Gln) amidotransferase subunit C
MLKKEDVEHVAKLSRLKLTDAEIEKFTPQLSSVFEMFDQPRLRRREAGKLDTEDLGSVEETSQVTGLENVAREDEIKQYPDQTKCTTEELLSNAPQKEGLGIIVPRVIEK